MPHIVKSKIKTFPDWPKKGVMFRDVMSLLKDVEGSNRMYDLLVARYRENKPDVIVGIESRGFIFGSVLAHKLGVSFVPVRKPGKLPGEVEFIDYKTEYSTDRVEIQKGSITPGTKVLVVDDLIATGGSMLAGCNLVKKLGGNIVECCVVIDLPDLKGSEKIEEAGYKVFKLVNFEGE